MIKDQSDLNDESQVLFHDSNYEFQRPFHFLCYLFNDEYMLITMILLLCSMKLKKI